MTNNLKKDYSKNSDIQQMNGKTSFYINPDDEDDQDIYISERSSVSSLNDINPASSLNVKRLPTPTPTPNSLLSWIQKQPYNLRYHNNDISDNIMPSITHVQLSRKEEKKKKNMLPKVAPGQGAAAPYSDAKSSEFNDDYHSYRSYYKIKNPEWSLQHRQLYDPQHLTNDSVDSLQYPHQPVLMTSSIKPKQQPRKPRTNGIAPMKTNQDKQRHDHNDKFSPTSSLLTFTDNHDNHYYHHYQQQLQQQQRHSPVESIDNDEYREQLSKRTIPVQRRKQKAENDLNDHYVQMHHSKSPPNSSALMITSNPLTNRSKARTKITEKTTLPNDIEENTKPRPTKPYNHSPPHHYHQNLVPPSHFSPSIPSQQNYQNHQQLHVRRRPPSGSNVNSDTTIVDGTTKKSDRTTYFPQRRDSFQLSTSPIYNQSSYLPPIIRENHHHHQKQGTNRFPNEYYGTLARQTHSKDWDESIEIQKLYKNDPQTRFYDRYLNNVVDKRLAA